MQRILSQPNPFAASAPQMFVHPQFDPVALQLGPFAIRWYGLMYLIGFTLVLLVGRIAIRTRPHATLSARDLDDVLFYGILGTILGGRLGYVLFYKFHDYLTNPLAILKVWEGGMSFHGGFLGVLVWGAAMTPFAAAWASITAVTGISVLGTARFMFPNVLAEPPSTVKVGLPTNYDPEDVNERFSAVRAAGAFGTRSDA